MKSAIRSEFESQWPNAPRESWHLASLNSTGTVSVFFVCSGTGKLFTPSVEWDAITDWLSFHNIDPTRVPLYSLIFRNSELHTITFQEYDLDDAGKFIYNASNLTAQISIRSEAGEAGPAPWPTVLGKPQPVGELRCSAGCLDLSGGYGHWRY